ncbi:MAG TPA: hypothetical protein PKW30_05965 [Campylobacterales bacterium]|nr:hypothetical protein [Campylobacterales bacterium]
MKQAAELFRHLSFASNNKVEFFSCINKLKKLFPPVLAKGVKSAYIKDDTLFFILENKTLEFEANYKLNSLTPILKEYCRMDPQCQSLMFSKIKAYSRAEPPKHEVKTTFLEKERSNGDFENNFTNETLREKLETIREQIKKNASKA